MAIHWQIIFKSLRAGETYTASVYDNTYTGQPVRLYPAATPFVTQEDGDDDPFVAIRTQSGSLTVVDNGYDMAGGSYNWRDMQPRSDHSRPVVLTNGAGDVVWQGFLQTKNFNGTLYEKVQNREFPIQCPIAVLATQYPTTSRIGIVNFAYLLKTCLDTIKAASLTVIGFDTIIVQGGADAQRWLLKKFHWANLLTESDDEGLAPQYNLFQCLEDMLNFWGFQLRIEGRTVYLMMADDPVEQSLLTLTEAELSTMATGTVAGTVSNSPFIRKSLAGEVFASADNDDMWLSGPSKVVIGADCNEQSTAFQFAPEVVRESMEAAGPYSWYHREGDDPQVGYYATPVIRSFDSELMSGTATTYAGFRREQIYSTPEADNPTLIDAFDFINIQEQSSVKLSIQTKQMMSFSGGSLKFSGSVFKLAEVWDSENNDDFLMVRIGIGETKESAKWFYMSVDQNGNLTHGWSSTVKDAMLTIGNGDIKGYGFLFTVQTPIPIPVYYTFKGIPTDDYMHGYVFVDFCGIVWDLIHKDTRNFTIGNFKVEYSRDEVYIPSNLDDEPRGRQIKKDRQSSCDYVAVNANAVEGEDNIDLTYASDNNMEYGYGLVMDADYAYMQGARYGGSLTLEHPEQHYADRIANFWSSARRMLTVDLRTEQVGSITPRSHLVTAGGSHFRTLAVSHNWRDDVTNVKMIQSTIEI